MRKPWLIKSVFAAAVLCTCFGVIAVLAEFAVYIISKMQDVSAPNMIPAIIIAAVCSFLLWEFHYSLTHDSLGRKIKPSAEPIYKKNVQYFPYDTPPIGRFAFNEDFFLKKMRNIANRFDLKLSYETSQSW
ncbi:MAG: hypothetical protein K2N71_02965, partial [Oscillospiraceae bacterium]|nr:hypothetical protein [Oscillospiraceae bacterium]